MEPVPEEDCKKSQGRASTEEKPTTSRKVTRGDATSYLVCSFADIPVDDLKKIRQAIDDEIGARKTVPELIKELKQAYDNIDWGYEDWKSEKTSDAISELEGLFPREAAIYGKIRDMEDVEEKWKTALSFSKVQAQMISTAEDYAGKLVNGRHGEWCPQTAQCVVDLWREIINSGSVPCEKTLSKVQRGLKGILGDYDYEDELGSLLANVAASRPRKRQRESPKTVATVDLTESP